MSTSSPTRVGILYLVATPIGNLGDLSPRVQETLASVDLILAEDTRRTRNLLTHMGLQRNLESYHRHTEREKAERYLNMLLSGTTLALVSDAGVPVISDPGAHITLLAHEAGISVIPIPGPSAVMTALSVSGFNADSFTFRGYPPVKTNDRQKFFKSCAQLPHPVVLFEAPHRIKESLVDAVTVFGADRQAFVAREMTKQFEEYRRGKLAELEQHFTQTDPLGEFTFIIGPDPISEDNVILAPVQTDEIIQLLLETQVPTKKAAAILAAATGIGRREAYQLMLQAGQSEE